MSMMTNNTVMSILTTTCVGDWRGTVDYSSIIEDYLTALNKIKELQSEIEKLQEPEAIPWVDAFSNIQPMTADDLTGPIFTTPAKHNLIHIVRSSDHPLSHWMFLQDNKEGVISWSLDINDATKFSTKDEAQEYITKMLIDGWDSFREAKAEIFEPVTRDDAPHWKDIE